VVSTPAEGPIAAEGAPGAVEATGPRRRRLVRGRPLVPVLILDDGEVVKDSSDIVAWAAANPRG
jgi:hypothetical protein